MRGNPPRLGHSYHLYIAVWFITALNDLTLSPLKLHSFINLRLLVEGCERECGGEGGEAVGSSGGRVSAGMAGSVTGPGFVSLGRHCPPLVPSLPPCPPAIPGFREVPWNAVWEGYVETKGSWEGVGFRDVPWNAVWEGYVETKGYRDRYGFRDGP